MGVGKEAASLGQRHIRLVKLNGAIKGLTTKAIYLIRKQILFSAPLIEQHLSLMQENCYQG